MMVSLLKTCEGEAALTLFVCVSEFIRNASSCCAGAKTHKTSELVRVVEKSGKSYTVKGEVGLSGLSPESRLYVELSDDGHSMCLSLEAAIAAEEQRSTKKVPFFPITIGR